MIRSSDRLFGRAVSTYQWVDREVIRQVIRELSSLDVHGIDKRIYQIMYERGFLQQDQIYAILESLLQSQQITKIKSLSTYEFTENDDKNLYTAWKLPYPLNSTEPISELPLEVLEQKLPISAENLLICLNIKHSLEKVGIHLLLLRILCDKRLLTSKFSKIIPDIRQRKRVILDPEEYTKARQNRSIALLFWRIANLQGYLKDKDFEQTIFVWQTLLGMEINIRYSEILFFLNLLDESTTNRIAESLMQIAGIDQKPRLALIHLSEIEIQHFQKLVNAGLIPDTQLNESKNLWLRVQQAGLTKFTLPELMIVQTKLTRKGISQIWAELCKKTIAEEVAKKQMEHTQEMMLEQPQDLNRELAQTQELVKQVEAEEKSYAESVKHKFIVSQSEEDQKVEDEIEETFQQTQIQRLQEMQKNAEFLTSKLSEQAPRQAKYLQTVIAHYHHPHTQMPSRIKLTILVAVIFIVLLCIVLLALEDKPLPSDLPTQTSTNNNNWNEESIQKDIELAKQLLKIYQYNQTIDIYKKLLTQIPEQHQLHTQIKTGLQQAIIYQKLIDDLNKVVQQKTNNIFFQFRGRESCQIIAISPDGLVIILDKGNSTSQIAWHDVKPEDIVQFWESYGIVQIHPWEVSLFCVEHRLTSSLRKSLAIYLNQNPIYKEKACNLLKSVTQHAASYEDYIIYEGSLYATDEVARLHANSNPPNGSQNNFPNPFNPPQYIPPESNTMSAVSWDQVDQWQTSILLKQRDEYNKSQQAQNKIFASQRWTTPELVEFENLALDKQNQNQVYFIHQQKKEWLPRAQLGQWCLVSKRKDTMPTTGFLLQNQNMYELRTNTGRQFLSENQILSKTLKIYPWDQYWKLRTDANNVLEHKHLAQWAESHNFIELSQIEWEQVAMLAPQHIKARQKLNYVLSANQWIPKTSAKSSEVYWQHTTLTPNQAGRMGLVLFENRWQLREDVAVSQLRNQAKTLVEDTSAGLAILGKSTIINSDLSCQSNYNFDTSEQLTSWSTNNNIELTQKSLQINAKTDSPQFTYWKAPLTGDCTITANLAFLEHPANNLMIRLYCTPNKSDYDGYLICLAHAQENNVLGHWIKSYAKPEGEILNQVRLPTLVAKRPFRLIIKIVGDKIEVHLNKQRLLRVNDKQFRQGFFGIGGWRSSIQIQDIQIQGSLEPQWYKQQIGATKPQKTTNQWQGISADVVQAWYNIPNPAWQIWKQERHAQLCGDQATAWVLCQTLIRNYPEFALAWLDRANIRKDLYDLPHALEDCQTALKFQTWDSAYLLRGKIYSLQGKTDLAMKDFSQALILNPKNIEAHYCLVQIYLQLDRKNQAIASIQSLSQEIPQAGQVLRTDMERVESGAFAQPKFVKTSGHYEISGEVPEVFGSALAAWLKQMDSHYQTIYGKIPNKKCSVLIFASRENLANYANLAIPEPMLADNAYWWPYRNEILVSLDQHPLLWSSALLSAVTQEWLSAQVPLPHFVSQGLLNYGEYCPLEAKQWAWWNISPYWRQHIQTELDFASDLDKITSLDTIYSAEQWWQYQIQSYAWIHFLLHSSEGRTHWQESWNKIIQSKESIPVSAPPLMDDFRNIPGLESSYQEYWKTKK